jgi:NAD(P)-dependent dehydrogenase (short-subunit alcohol dehydrogenase family)
MRDPSKRQALDAACLAAKVRVQVLPLDVTKQASIDACIAAVKRSVGQLDVLVNNAGIAVGGYFEDQRDSEVREQFETNVFGLMAMTRGALRLMRAQRSGRIVNVSSMGGRVGTPGLAPYCATKFAVEGFSEALHHELAGEGIDVILVEPGTFPTDIFFGNRRTALDAQKEGPRRARFVAGERAVYEDVQRRNPNPKRVGEAIALAASEEKPRLRYPVGADAKTATIAMRLLPARLWHFLIGSRFNGLRPSPLAPALPPAAEAQREGGAT